MNHDIGLIAPHADGLGLDIVADNGSTFSTRQLPDCRLEASIDGVVIGTLRRVDGRVTWRCPAAGTDGTADSIIEAGLEMTLAFRTAAPLVEGEIREEAE